MNTLSITTTYTLTTDTTFDLPEGKEWDDVKDYHVKWGTLYLTFNDNTTAEIKTNGATFDDADFKRPDTVTIRQAVSRIMMPSPWRKMHRRNTP
jgi:hypothetical protein